MERFDKIFKSAQENLNDSFRHLYEAPNDLAREFVELKLQSCIFQFDVSSEMINIMRNKPEGFASSVSLKGLVLRLFEYDHALNHHLIPRLVKLLENRNIPINYSHIKALKQNWKKELTELQAWHEVRNGAAGHYGKNLTKQFELLESLKFENVMTVTTAFLSFNLEVQKILGIAGKGVVSST